jgi:hypothetical protein
VHTPPPEYFYYGPWCMLVSGAGLVIASPFFMEWEPLVVGVVMLIVGIPAMAFLAWWRDRYNEWHLEDRGLVDHMGFPVPRLLLLSDEFATKIIDLIWPSFRSERPDIPS